MHKNEKTVIRSIGKKYIYIRTQNRKGKILLQPSLFFFLHLFFFFHKRKKKEIKTRQTRRPTNRKYA